MRRHPWIYVVFWNEPTQSVIPHPNHAMFREIAHAEAHVVYLATRGIRATIGRLP